MKIKINLSSYIFCVQDIYRDFPGHFLFIEFE